MKRLPVIAIFFTAIGNIFGVEPEFRALKEDYARKAAVIERLRAVPIRDLKINQASPGEALSILQKKGSGNEADGVINCVIRFPKVEGRPDVDSFSGRVERSWKPEKVTLEVGATTFASAIDQICHQAGMVWAIEFNESGAAPVLVITENPKGQQDEDANVGHAPG